jgi:hypothetical protein
MMKKNSDFWVRPIMKLQGIPVLYTKKKYKKVYAVIYYYE